MTVKMPDFIATPDYVHDLLDTLIGHEPLNFHGHPVPADVHHRLVHKAGRPAPLVGRAATSKVTDRELQVLAGMADGKSNQAIGDGLFISEDTVKTHARRLFKKIGARDRAHAVATGIRMGLIK